MALSWFSPQLRVSLSIPLPKKHSGNFSKTLPWDPYTITIAERLGLPRVLRNAVSEHSVLHGAFSIQPSFPTPCKLIVGSYQVFHRGPVALLEDSLSWKLSVELCPLYRPSYLVLPDPFPVSQPCHVHHAGGAGFASHTQPALPKSTFCGINVSRQTLGAEI